MTSSVQMLVMRMDVPMYERTSRGIAENISSDVEVFPDNEGLDGTKLQCLQRILDTVAVLSGVLADLVEVPLDELLLLDELHVGQRLRCKLDCL